MLRGDRDRDRDRDGRPVCALLNEWGWNRDAIERQLAHSEQNGVRAAYNYAEHLPLRRKMMQAWADYLDAMRITGKAVKFPPVPRY